MARDLVNKLLPDLTEPVARWAASSAELYRALIDQQLVDQDRVRHVMHKQDRKRVARELADKGLSTRRDRQDRRG